MFLNGGHGLKHENIKIYPDINTDIIVTIQIFKVDLIWTKVAIRLLIGWVIKPLIRIHILENYYKKMNNGCTSMYLILCTLFKDVVHWGRLM